MIRMSIMYPQTPGGKFDIDYYVDTHMPMSIKLMSPYPGFRGVSVEHGMSGVEPGSAPAFVAVTHFLFDSSEEMWNAIAPHGEALQEDMLHCTDIVPVIQFNDVRILERR